MSNPLRTSVFKVFAALAPAVCCSVYFFGLDAVRVISACIVSAVLCELAVNLVTRSKITIGDCTAALTGLLLAMCLPPKISCFHSILGSMFAILIVKMPFGGFGGNIFNPALAARAFLLLFFTSPMATWTPCSWNVSAGDIETITTATPLTHIKFNLANLDWSNFDVVGDLFFGNVNGSLGETSALALIIGGIILFVTKTSSPIIPLSYISTVAVFAFFCGDVSPLVEILSGGLLLGAIFMASDYVTSPSSPRGKIIFGFGCGILTMLIRRFPGSGFPEGVAFAVLIMNAATPFINRLTSRTVTCSKV